MGRSAWIAGNRAEATARAVPAEYAENQTDSDAYTEPRLIDKAAAAPASSVPPVPGTQAALLRRHAPWGLWCLPGPEPFARRRQVPGGDRHADRPRRFGQEPLSPDLGLRSGKQPKDAPCRTSAVFTLVLLVQWLMACATPKGGRRLMEPALLGRAAQPRWSRFFSAVHEDRHGAWLPLAGRPQVEEGEVVWPVTAGPPAPAPSASSAAPLAACTARRRA